MALGRSIDYLINIVVAGKGFEQNNKNLEHTNKIIKRMGKNTLPEFAKVSSVSMDNFSKKVGKTFVPMKRMTVAGVTAKGAFQKYSFELDKTTDKMGGLRDGFKMSTKASDNAHKSFGHLAGGVGKLAMRAALVAPLWMAMRSVMMAATQAVGDAIKTYVDLEREMGRVATVTRGGKEDLDKLKAAVLDYSSTASKGFKEAASAIYALGCLKPDGLILTSEGVKEIQHIKKGDSVFGFDGQLTKVVSDLIIRDCTEKEIVKIKTLKNLPFEVTPNHPVYGVKSVICPKHSIYNKICKESCKRQCQSKPYKDYKLEWIPAGELKEGDFLVIPKIKKRKDVTLNFDFGRNKKVQKNFPKKLDNDFALFLGTILGDGWSCKDGERVGIAFGNKDKKHKEWCQRYIKSLGYSYFTNFNKEKTCTQLVIWSRVLNKFIAKHIGRKAWNKRIPMFMFNAKDELIYSFLRGYYLSDGTKIENKEKCSIAYRTTSPHIAHSINYLVSKLGSSFTLDKHIPDVNAKIKGKVYKYHPSYGIRSSNFDDFANKVCGVEKDYYPKFQKTWQDDNYIYFRITSIDKKFYDGKVYNFETEDNTYSVGVIVHNSAGMTVSQQMSGFKHIMDLSIGTFGNTEEIAKLVSGSFNVFGKSLKGAYTESAKFKKISDVLAFTYSCYTPDTEVLTDQGWKLFTELDRTEEMATLNPDTFELIYQKPYDYINQKFEGNLHHIKGKFVDIMVTPNHKLFANMRHNPVSKKFELIEAKDAWGRAKKFYRGSKWQGKEEEYFYLPKVNVTTNSKNIDKIKMEDWLEFLGWYLSEGCCFINDKGTYRLTIYQSKYRDKVKTCLDKLPWNYYFDDPSKRGKDSCPRFSIYNKQLVLYLKQFGLSHDKFIPENVKQLSKRLLRLFIKFYAYGDGSIPKKDNWGFGIGTSSVRMRDDFQEIALKADYGCTYCTKSKGGFKGSGIGYGLGFSERDKFKLKSKKNKTNKLKTSNEELVPYKGNVVCVEIPNHILFVRRNGKSFWCGNTQQVELSEIATAMSYVASMGQLVDVSFEHLVTTIGVLNSGMLKGCYDSETELLTNQGWKFFKDLNKTEEVATLNPETKEIIYQKPIEYIDAKYKGKMYKVKNRFIDLLVTPNHNMFTKLCKKNQDTSQYKLRRADFVYGDSQTFVNGLSNIEELEVETKDWQQCDYDGRQYCVEVDKYHTLFIRRGGKTCWCGNTKSGTALMNSFLALATKGDKLATLGVAFDPSKPLDLIDVMSQLHDIYGKQGKSLTGLKDLMDVFGRRGGRAAAQLVQDFERWKTAIDDTEAKFDDFAENMKEKAEATLPMAWDKLWNSMKVDFAETMDATGLSNFIIELAKAKTDITEIKKYKRITSDLGGLGRGAMVGLFDTVYTKEERAIAKQRIKANKELIDVIEEVLSKEKEVTKTKEKTRDFSKTLNFLGGRLHAGLIEEKGVRNILLSLVNEHGNLTKKEQKRVQEIVDTLYDKVKIKKKELEIETKLDVTQKKKIKDIDRAAKIDLMKVIGYKEEAILREKIADKVADVNALLSISKTEGLEVLDVAELTSGQFEKWEKALISVGGKSADLLSIRKMALKLELEGLKEIEGYGKKIRTSFQGSFTDFLSGGSTLGEVFTKTSETFKKTLAGAFSEGMTESIFNVTGMDEMMGGFATKLKYAGQGMAGKLKEGYDYHAKLLRQVFGEHAAGGSIYAGGMVGGGGGYSSSGFGFTMPGFGSGGFMTQPIDPSGLYGVKGGKIGPAPRGQRSGATYGQVLGVAGSTAMAVQGGGGLGTAGGIMSGLGGVGMGIGMMQAGAAVGTTFGAGGMLGATALGPIGIALMIGGMIMSSMQEAPTTHREEVKEQTRQISSRIDISNKQLDFVNRNLVSLRSEMTFIMEKSFYFSQRTEEDNFMIGSSRGGV